MANMIYMAYDGDNAGRLVGRAILSNDENTLSEVSGRISHGHDIVGQWVQDHGGKIISGGGDEGTFAIPQEALDDIEQLRADYQFATQLTMTIGAGSTLAEAGKALMAGKFRGKDQVVQYDPSVDQDLIQAQEHIASGTGSAEENKLGEAYLNKEEDDMAMSEDKHEHTGDDCKYCQEADAKDHEHSGDDCKYCQEADSADHEHSGDDCKYCQEAEEADHEHSGDDCEYCQEADAKDHEHSGDDCQYCAEANQGNEDEKAPKENESIPASTQIDEKEADENQRDAISGDAVAPSAGSQQASSGVGPDDQEESPSNGAVVEELTQQVDGDGQQTDQELVDAIDAPDAPLGDEMEDNVSRPEGYTEDNTPGDMGLSEDEVPEESPDLGEVLKDGLDNHADNIAREKVITLVSQALEGFKANKAILEQAKEQAPEFYQSSIMMLKAMIEMAKMLGLSGDAEEAPQQQQEPVQPEEAQPGPAAGQGAAAQAPQQ